MIYLDNPKFEVSSGKWKAIIPSFSGFDKHARNHLGLDKEDGDHTIYAPQF